MTNELYLKRDDVLNLFEEYQSQSKLGGYVYDFGEALKDLKFRTLESQQRWIPVSDRLPEIVEWYLTSIKWDDGTERVIISWFDGMSFKAEVTAWMPLPESYRDESDE